MIPRCVLLLVALILAAACSKPQPVAQNPCDASPNNVITIPDVKYGRARGQTLDLYLPFHRAGEPLVLFVHGGSWISGDKHNHRAVAEAFARCGMAYAAMNYPLAPQVRARAQARSALRAAGWLRDHAAAYGFAPDRIFLMGHSAGAELVVLAALDPHVSVDRVRNGPISGIIALDGTGYDPTSSYRFVADIPPIAKAYAAAFGPRSNWQTYNVMEMADAHAPPFLIVHALDDTLVPASDSAALAASLRQAGASAAYLQPSGRTHESVLTSLADPADPTGLAIKQFVFSGKVNPGLGAAPAAVVRVARTQAALVAKKVRNLTKTLIKQLPKPDHVVIVVEENKSFATIIGNKKAPFINQLAMQGALFTQSYAITHPSAPNYLALFSGQINHNGDSCPESGVAPTAPNLGGELIADGLDFASYSETMPYSGYTGCSAGFGKWTYARKHNPWVNFSSVPPQSNQPFSALPPYGDLPTIAFIVPNQAHDMHSGSIEDGDEWLRLHIGPIVSWAAKNNTLVIITFDEDDRRQNNQIPTIFIGPMVAAGKYGERIDHYALLRTLEEFYGLPHAGNSANAAIIKDCWRSIFA